MYGPDKVPLSKSPKAGQKVANMKVLSFTKRSMNTNRNWSRLGVLCTKNLRWFRTCTDAGKLILGDEIKVINGVTAV